MKYGLAGLVLMGAMAVWFSHGVLAQELDLEKPVLHAHPAVQAPAVTVRSQPLTATVSKTLYLPDEMYGYWSLNGTLLKTNAPDRFSPSLNNIWILQRDGDRVTITNPNNGASATINVDRVEGLQATFHRSGAAGRNMIFQEIPTITVTGDRLSGTSLNQLQTVRDGVVQKEYFALYQLNGVRLSGGSARFKPEQAGRAPDIEIQDVKRR